jgi:hypothetical protein
MKFAKSILVGTGAVVLAGLILTMLVPKAARAVAATAVQVMNTSANPVPGQNVDEAGRSPYQSAAAPYCTPGQECYINFSAVPAGKRLVTSFLTGQFSIPSSQTISVVLHNSTDIFGGGLDSLRALYVLKR